MTGRQRFGIRTRREQNHQERATTTRRLRCHRVLELSEKQHRVPQSVPHHDGSAGFPASTQTTHRWFLFRIPVSPRHPRSPLVSFQSHSNHATTTIVVVVVPTKGSTTTTAASCSAAAVYNLTANTASKAGDILAILLLSNRVRDEALKKLLDAIAFGTSCHDSRSSCSSSSLV